MVQKVKRAKRRLDQFFPQIVEDMQDIELIYIEGSVAKYRIRKNELYGGEMLTITYYLYFIIDEDGLWKIHRY
jgi:hypothetical protein